MGNILLLLSIFLFGAAFWLWHLRQKQVGSFAVKTRPHFIFRHLDERENLFRKIEYSGVAKLPKRVYVNDSVIISIELKREQEISISGKEPSKFVYLEFREEPSKQQFLEIELQAAAFTIDGEKKQKHFLNFEAPHSLSFLWNCFCPNSGTHYIALIFRVVGSSDMDTLGGIEQKIKVVRVDHLTQRQVGIIASGTTIIGCVSTVIGIITNFPTLLHIIGVH